MKLYKKILFILPGIATLLGACLNLKQPSNKIEFYTLEYDPPQLSDHKPLPYSIRLEPFTVAPEYNSDRIIYRDKSFKRDSYVYHRWHANPGNLVASFLGRDMKNSGLFKAVLPYDTRLPSSYLLEGLVNEFLEWDAEEKWEAVLTLSVTLMAGNEPDVNQRILFQKNYHARELCKQKNPRALADAMSQAMSTISREIIETLYNHLGENR